MKYKILTLFTAISFLGLSACGTEAAGPRTGGGTQSVSDVLEAGMQEEKKGTISTPDATSTPTPMPSADAADGQAEGEASGTAAEGVDVDLTIMSATMVYSEVYNMMYTPEEYVGKRVRMEGTYSFFHDEESGMDYYACVIQDATACCAQGLEFVPLNPEKCPEEGGMVTVEGTFATYIEGDYTYCTLREATVL